ncbi:MAG: hydrogenase maturation protease [Candidatus Kariarchaeaceae archaeon]|jgi:coenzyme F420 hydrogenase subunit delta
MMKMYTTHLIGCGNILKGDDGFGPAVVRYLEENYVIPDDILMEDAGLACADWLLNLVHDVDAPKMIVVVDAQDMREVVGTITVKRAIEMDLPDSSINRHLFPDINVVQQLHRQGVDLVFVSCQVGYIPEDLFQGISDEMKSAIPLVSQEVADLLKLTRK